MPFARNNWLARLAPAVLAAGIGLAAAEHSVAASSGFSLLTPERIWDMARMSDLALSPDGKKMAFTVASYPVAGDRPMFDVWMVETSGKRDPVQLTRNFEPDLYPAWSADSRQIIYSSSRDPGDPLAAYVLDLRGGEPQLLFKFPTSVRKPRFRPGLDRIVFEADTFADVNADTEALALRLATLERETSSAFASESRFRWRHGRPVPVEMVRHVFEFNMETNTIVDLTPGFARSTDLAPFHWDLSRDGNMLAFSGLSSPPPYLSLDLNLFLQRLPTGESQSLELENLTTDRVGSVAEIRFAANGDLYFSETRRADDLAGNHQIVRFRPKRRDFAVLTDPSIHSPEQWQLDPTGENLLFHAERRGRKSLFRQSANGGKARVLVEGGTTSDIQVGNDGSLYYLESQFSRPASIFRTDANGNHRRHLSPLNDALLEDTRIGSVREFEFPGYMGEPVHGFLALPPGFSADRQWPVLLLLHGGPHSAWLDQFHFRWNLLGLASPGYLVAAINPHGSTGYGESFARSIEGDPLIPAAEDARAAVRWLEQQPHVDSDRIALIGNSYGGFLANWMLSHNNNFRAGIVHAGVFDLMAQYASDYPWGRARTYGAVPWEAPERYRELSPSSHVDSWVTPTLLLHGLQDSRVPPSHSLLLHNILTAKGVPTRVVLFPDQQHRITDRNAAIRWWQEVFSWLGRHLAQRD